MSLLVPSAGGLQMLSRQLYGRGGIITAATNATPTVVTAGSIPTGGSPANTSTSHGLAAGNCVTIAGALGNTNINGTFTVGTVTSTTFQLYPTASGTGGTAVNGNGVLSGSPFWTLAGMENAALKLTTTAHTPAESDTAATYTEVANGSGYTTGGQTLQSLLAAASGAVWVSAATVGSGGTGNWAQTAGGSFSASTNVPESTATQLTWSWSGTVSGVNGYYVVGSTTGTIWWAEQFAAAKNFSNGDTLNLTARLGYTHS